MLPCNISQLILDLTKLSTHIYQNTCDIQHNVVKFDVEFEFDVKLDVVCMPFKCSDMPYKMFYSTIIAEVLRICRATSSYLFFLESFKKNLSFE